MRKTGRVIVLGISPLFLGLVINRRILFLTAMGRVYIVLGLLLLPVWGYVREDFAF